MLIRILTRKWELCCVLPQREFNTGGILATQARKALRAKHQRQGDPELSGRPLPPVSWKDKVKRCSLCSGSGSPWAFLEIMLERKAWAREASLLLYPSPSHVSMQGPEGQGPALDRQTKYKEIREGSESK